MGRYIQIEFKEVSEEQSDQLIALLNEIGFDGFEETDTILKAFIPEKDFDRTKCQTMIASVNLDFSETIIEETNWNLVWESSFEPVVVDDFVAVRAHFHAPIKDIQHEIIITPKMSFGTGHHATTYMMMRQMKELDFQNKKVFDFGTGTGVLAILAEKLGAQKTVAIDNDEWSIENAKENKERNSCSAIDLQLSDSVENNENFDIILANINKNVILDNLDTLARQLVPGGILLLSGLLTPDEQEILDKCNKIGLQFDAKTERHNWLFLRFSQSETEKSILN